MNSKLFSMMNKLIEMLKVTDLPVQTKQFNTV